MLLWGNDLFRCFVVWFLWQEILIHKPILKMFSQPFWAHLGLLLHLLLCLPTPTSCSPFVSILQGWQLSSWYDLLFSFCEVGFVLGQLLLLTSLPQCACWCTLTAKCEEGDRMEWLGACKDAYLFFMVMKWINWSRNSIQKADIANPHQIENWISFKCEYFSGWFALDQHFSSPPCNKSWETARQC